MSHLLCEVRRHLLHQIASASLLEVAPCLMLAVQPNIMSSAISEQQFDPTRLGITDELLTNSR